MMLRLWRYRVCSVSVRVLYPCSVGVSQQRTPTILTERSLFGERQSPLLRDSDGAGSGDSNEAGIWLAVFI